MSIPEYEWETMHIECWNVYTFCVEYFTPFSDGNGSSTLKQRAVARLSPVYIICWVLYRSPLSFGADVEWQFSGSLLEFTPVWNLIPTVRHVERRLWYSSSVVASVVRPCRSMEDRPGNCSVVEEWLPAAAIMRSLWRGNCGILEKYPPRPEQRRS